MTITSEPDEKTPAALFEALRYDLSCLIALFGAPTALAVLGVLGLTERRDILAWLAPLERLARKLLLIDALTLPTPPKKPRRRARLSARAASWRSIRNAQRNGRCASSWLRLAKPITSHADLPPIIRPRRRRLDQSPHASKP